MKRYDPVAHGAHCHVCPLKGNVVVPPAPASKRLKLVIVGEGPGRVEEKVGIPFMGSSGKFLDQLLFQQGKDFPRASIHMTNAMLCRGELENDMKTAEVCCAPRLLRELAALPKEVPIVTLGKSAAKSVLGTRSIFMARGFVWTVKAIEVEAVRAARVAYRKSTGRIIKRGPKGGVKELKVKPGSPTTQIKARLKWLVLKWRRRLSGRMVFPTIHPAFVLRADTWQPILQLDMRRALRAARGEKLVLKDTGPYWHVRTAKEFKQHAGKFGALVGVDIETRGIDPLTAIMLCVGISDGVNTIVVDPRQKTEDEAVVWGGVLVKTMQLFLERRTVVMHNGYNFDQIVMRQHGFVFVEGA